MVDGNGNQQNGKPHTFVVIGGSTDLAMRSIVPPHLAQTPWIKHETSTAKAAFKDVRRELMRLIAKISEKRVHNARVALRRWNSVWKVLKEDGWETAKCKKRITRPIKRLGKLLGELRDIDVNLEVGERLNCTDNLKELWKSRRQELQTKLEEYIETQDISGVLSDLKRYIRKRSRDMHNKLPRAKSGQSAFDHLELFLLHQESIVREEAETAQTPEELHQMRLSIKRWRYLLTEFFGLTNLQLVRAQQLLGQLHDLDRLTPVLVHDDAERQALLELKERRKALLERIEEMRHQLPYGLRPQVSSVKTSASAQFGESRT